MNALTSSDFDAYFRALHGYAPYSWQARLAEQAIAGQWPSAIDLPTSSGKTACLDIAVFALACQAAQAVAARTAPVRIFFCVNRRVIVDEAYERAKKIAKKLWKAERDTAGSDPVLRAVAAALRKVARPDSTDGDEPPDSPPLDRLELRGGVYRDNRWARSAAQPTIVCTTIDQLGSRLLFRGYGVSHHAAPIQASLVAYDSLILLDEAHISRPFQQTLSNVRRYLDPEKWAAQPIGIRPVVVVPMTATPADGAKDGAVIRLDAKDRENERLANRLRASKPAKLIAVKEIVAAAVKAAKELAKDKPTAVGIIVNRVDTARRIFNALRNDQEKSGKGQPKAVVELVIGSMRPIDRDNQTERLETLLGPDRPDITTRTSFIVSTQCLEVGADYDFDVMITECASLDALRQRLGRLNRGGRAIDAQAVILAETKSIKPDDRLDDEKPSDPIYGNALARTWNWLARVAVDDTVDFGVDAFDKLLRERGDEGRLPDQLLAPSASLDAPVMLPAHLDLWCQTSPPPAPDPDVALFLHGEQHGEPDVQVCWRADLVDDGVMSADEHWCEVVSLFPPTAVECLTAPLSRVRRWFAGDGVDARDGDLLESPAEENEDLGGKSRGGESRLAHRGVLWRGPRDSKLLASPQELQPGDTLVLPVEEGGWKELGHIPTASSSQITEKERGDFNKDAAADNDTTPLAIDIAEAAFRLARDRAALRLHPSLHEHLPPGDAFKELFTLAADREQSPTVAEWQSRLRKCRDALPADADETTKICLKELAKGGFVCELYPDGRGVVLASRKRLYANADWYSPLDEGDDSPSRTRRDRPISLADHTQHVVETLRAALLPLPLGELAESLLLAAARHDWGKADERFQAVLHRSDRTYAWLSGGDAPNLIAKSAGMPLGRKERLDAVRRAGLPDGFRHEMLSLQLVSGSGDLPAEPALRDLVLHLVAAHHGRARPFAPVVLDDDPQDVAIAGCALTKAERIAAPPHRLDSGVAERFWSLTRRFGWWAVAYLEAILRLADQQASAAEDAGAFDEAALQSAEPDSQAAMEPTP